MKQHGFGMDGGHAGVVGLDCFRDGKLAEAAVVQLCIDGEGLLQFAEGSVHILAAAEDHNAVLFGQLVQGIVFQKLILFHYASASCTRFLSRLRLRK